MSARREQLPGLTATADLEWIDAIADRFEDTWRRDGEANIADFLAGTDGPRRFDLLFELIKIDLNYRWKRGDCRKVEDYLAEFPELQNAQGLLPDQLVQFTARLHQESGDDSVGEKTEELAALSPPEASRMHRAGELPRTLGKFQLLQLLGQGAFGSVYKGRDPALDRWVAIKTPRAGYFATPEAEARFQREAQSAAQLRHPHIVPVHDVAREGDMPYIVSEYVAGRTLAQVLADQRPDFRASAELLVHISDALEYAHQHGVIHRDVSPRNILIDAAGQPHITDFGLARREDAGAIVTLDGQVLGTPAYMSPEQAAGEQSKVDRRSDVYSLGVIAYELLTGELPFRGTPRMVLNQVLQDEPRPPHQLNDRIPRDLETICLKAMNKAPDRRYATVGELGADLRRWLCNEPIRARPAGYLERGWRWVRRNPRVAGLSSVVVLLLATVMFGSIVAAILIAASRREITLHLARTQQSLSETQSARGVALLDAKNPLGLLDLLESRKTAAATAGAAQSRALLWSGWYAACPRLAQMVGHDTGIDGVALSKDGRVLMTAAKDGTVQLWDPASGLAVGPLHEGISPGFGNAALSPDGRVLAVITHNHKLELRATQTGQLCDNFVPHAADCVRVVFSPDGKLLAAAYNDATLRLWNVTTGRLHGRPMLNDAHDWAIAFSPAGELVAIGSNQTGIVRLWNTAASTLRAEIKHHSNRVYDLAFSSDGKKLATASWDNSAGIWDTVTGRAVTPPLPHGEHVHAVAFSPNGQWLATGSYDLTARLWDATNGRLRYHFRHEGPVVSVAFSPDGRLLATGCHDATARLWDTNSGALHGRSLPQQNIVSSVAFHPNGNWLVTASADGAARIWELPARSSSVLPHQDRVWTVAWSPNGKRLATGSEDHAARIWDAQTGQLLIGPIHHTTEVLAIAWSSDGRLLATGAGGGNPVRLWDSANGRPHGDPIPHPLDLRCVAFSPDGRSLAFGGLNHIDRMGTTLLCDLTGRPLVPPMSQPGRVNNVAFSPDGKRLASGGESVSVLIWDTATGHAHGQPLPHGGWVEALAFRPDGRLLATSSRDLTLRLWNPETSNLHGQAFRLQAPVQSLAFSPDGRLLAAADGGARLLDLTTGLSCGPIMTHEGTVTAVAFRPDGRRLGTGSFDKTARIWPVPWLVTDVNEMQLRTWVALGARLNEQGIVAPIPWREWQSLRDQLRALEARDTSRSPE